MILYYKATFPVGPGNVCTCQLEFSSYIIS